MAKKNSSNPLIQIQMKKKKKVFGLFKCFRPLLLLLFFFWSYFKGFRLKCSKKYGQINYSLKTWLKKIAQIH
jgi:hypothetical protein